MPLPQDTFINLLPLNNELWTLGSSDVSPGLCNLQTNMEVLRDRKRCSELAPEDKGGEVGLCCVTVENHVTSLSSIFLSQIEIIIIIAAKPGLWWWSKERNMRPPLQSYGLLSEPVFPARFTHAKLRGNYKSLPSKVFELDFLNQSFEYHRKDDWTLRGGGVKSQRFQKCHLFEASCFYIIIVINSSQANVSSLSPLLLQSSTVLF